MQGTKCAFTGRSLLDKGGRSFFWRKYRGIDCGRLRNRFKFGRTERQKRGRAIRLTRWRVRSGGDAGERRDAASDDCLRQRDTATLHRPTDADGITTGASGRAVG